MAQAKTSGEAEPGVASVYGAALARKAPVFLAVGQAISSEAETEAMNGSTSTALTVSSQGSQLERTGSDWSATLDLVERAASTIKAYERRLAQLEREARNVAESSAQEIGRLQNEVEALDERLREAEVRAGAAGAMARDEAFHRWEAERRVREAEERAVEAEAYSQRTEDYLRRVHSILSKV